MDKKRGDQESDENGKSEKIEKAKVQKQDTSSSSSESNSYSDDDEWEEEEEELGSADEFTSSSSESESDSDSDESDESASADELSGGDTSSSSTDSDEPKVIKHWEDIEDDEERRKAKIRWLLGITDSPLIQYKCKPESGPKALREDNDVSYENVKTSVEKCFGLNRDGYVVGSYLDILQSNDILKAVKHRLSCILKQMNSMGLLRFANTVTGGSIPFEKTRKKMKEIILECIRKMSRNPGHEDHKRFMEELPKLLKDPCHFRETSTLVELVDADFVCQDFLCHHCAAKKLLKGLESMDARTLDAMKRRLNGTVITPTFPCHRPSHSRTRVRNTVKRKFESLDRIVCGRDKLPPRLAKAMSIVDLNFKMKNDDPKIVLPKFYTFEEEFGLTYTNIIHNELLRAIRILDGTKLDKSVRQMVRSVLDPKLEMGKVFRKENIQNWLIEYLFECSEIDPKEFEKAGVSKVCEIIESYAFEKGIRSSDSVPCIEKEKAKEKVENVLALSGQLKQIVLDYMPDHKMDEEFNDAYIKKVQLYSDEEFEDLKKDHVSHSDDESVGECEADASVLAAELISGGNASKLEDIGQDSSEGADNEQIPVNKYLVVQEICDETSLIAHQHIGRSLEKKLHNKGVELEESKLLYLRGGLCNQEDIKNKETHLNCASPNPGDKRKRSYVSGSTSNTADSEGKYGSLNSKGSKSKAERCTEGKEKMDGKSKDTTPKTRSKLKETPRTQGDKVKVSSKDDDATPSRSHNKAKGDSNSKSGACGTSAARRMKPDSSSEAQEISSGKRGKAEESEKKSGGKNNTQKSGRKRPRK